MQDFVKSRANGRNIVAQKPRTLLHVTHCVFLPSLLHVVRSCCAKFETGQTFSYVQTDATTPNSAASCCQQCCVRLRTRGLRPHIRSYDVPTVYVI